jgi:hypothetical protein
MIDNHSSEYNLDSISEKIKYGVPNKYCNKDMPTGMLWIISQYKKNEIKN